MRIPDIAEIKTLITSLNAFYDGTGKLSRPARAQVAADIATSTTNATAVVTYAASTTLKHVLTGVVASYVGTTPIGTLKVEDVSGTTIFLCDVIGTSPVVIVFPEPIKAALVNTAMIVTLSAGGSGVVGHLNCFHRTEA